jgi:hypothetical protein
LIAGTGAFAAGRIDRAVTLAAAGRGIRRCQQDFRRTRRPDHNVFSAHQGVEDDDMNFFA